MCKDFSPSKIFVIFAPKMKHLLMLSVILLAFACCTTEADSNRLCAILSDVDAVIEDNADSAYKLLQTIPERLMDSNETSRAYYTLLMAQATYKLYKPVPSDSLLRQTVFYYKNTGNLSKLCRAIYYRAVPLYEQGHHDDALLLLKEGEKLAKELGNVLYMAKYHESLCMVNYKAGCNNLMMKYAKLFLDDAINLKDSVLISRGYSHVASSFFSNKQYEEAKKFILNTLPLIHTMRSSSQAYILTNIACTLHKSGDLTAAKDYLQKSLNANPMSNTYAELGDIYAEEGNIEKAEECWQRGLESDNPLIVVNSQTSRYRQYKQKHDYASALSILEQVYHLHDSLSQASEREKLNEIQVKYDQEVIKGIYSQRLNIALGCAVIALIIILIFVIYHRRKVRTFTNTINEKEKAIMHAMQKIEVLENSGEEHSEEIEVLKKQIVNIRRQTNERLGIGKSLYAKVLNGGHVHPTDDIHCLIEYYSIIRYEIYARWMDDYKALTPGQLVILVLEDMGKNKLEIQQILHMSNSAYRTAKSRLNNRKRQ